jgi:two-component system cell cycle sensor histidine kinase/response regulator CckA
MGNRTGNGNGKILVMDDDKIMRLIAGFLLDQLGYEAEVAANGEEAVELYQKQKHEGKPFDAVILDIRVGKGMGGGETMQQLLRIDPDVQVVVSSGSHCDPLMIDFMQYGFRNALPKPYGAAELKRVLSSVLAGDDADSFDMSQGKTQQSPFAIS